MSWQYIAGFFDGEGSISTMQFSRRTGIASSVACLAQTGDEGYAVLTAIKNFMWERGVKSYITTQKRIKGYRVMHNLRVCAKPSVIMFLREALPYVHVKKVKTQDTLRFSILFPSIRGSDNAERNKRGAKCLDVEGMESDLAAGMTISAVARKHGVCFDTVKRRTNPAFKAKNLAYHRAYDRRKFEEAVLERTA